MKNARISSAPREGGATGHDEDSGARGAIAAIFGEGGIEINGARPWDVQVHDDAFYDIVLGGGSLALGESYMDKLWDCERLDEFFARLIPVHISKGKALQKGMLWPIFKAKLVNLQSKTRAHQVAETHYDLGNDFYAHMLGPRMQYTCAYWKDADNLVEAQEAKLELICRKLELKPSDKVLELGCGWGGFAKYAAERYGCEVTGCNISKEQVEYARESCAGLPVTILRKDYRDAEGRYDKVAAIGLCEHVGSSNYREFMGLIHRRLKDGGLALVHTIGRNTSARAGELDPWIQKYVFPNGQLPSLKQLADAAEGLFVIEDVHNFGASYDKTLMAWHANFVKHWPRFEAAYGERFFRMWSYYLLSCAGAFRARSIQLWQLVLSKEGAPGGYDSIR